MNDIPKSWYIEMNNDNYGLLGLYFKGNAGYFEKDFINVTLFSSGNLEFKTKKQSIDAEYYKEISTEQFKKYVLKL